MERFSDRQDAGRRLAAALGGYASQRPIVLGLPRGGVPVADEVARALHAPLDVWVVRKVGVPWQPELGAGAVAEGGYLYLNPSVVEPLGLGPEALDEVIRTKQREVEARVRLFRGDRPPPVVRDRTVIVVDDGIATGGTVRAAVRSIRAQGPRAIVVAAPVASPDVIQSLAGDVDRVVCLFTPADLYAIGVWYVDFTQVEDAEVVRILERSRRQLEPGGPRRVAL